MLGLCQVAEKRTLGEIHKDPAAKKAQGIPWNKQLHLEHRGFLEELNWARFLGAEVGNFLKVKLKTYSYISGQWVHYILIVNLFDCPSQTLYALQNGLFGLIYNPASPFLLVHITRLHFPTLHSSVNEMW